MIYIEKDENGNLVLTTHEDFAEEIHEASSKKDDLSILIEMTEQYWTNGRYQPFDAGDGNPFVGLTDAPCIAESMNYDDEGDATIEGDFWYYPDYMIRSFIEEMMTEQKVIFKKA